MPFMEMIARVGLDGSAVQAGLSKIKGSVRSAASSMASSAGGFAKSQLGAAIGVASVLQFAKSTIEMGGQIADMSTRLGISAEEVQKWNYAATQCGATAQDVTSFFEKLTVAKQKAIKGDKAAIESFRNLGVSMDDLENKKIADIGLQIGNVFARGGSPQELLPSLKTVGGRSAGALIAPMAAGLEPAFDKAQNAGVIIDDAKVAQLDEAGDAISTFMLQLRGLFVDLIPLLTVAGTTVKYFITTLGDTFNILIFSLPNLISDIFTKFKTATFGTKSKEMITKSFTANALSASSLEEANKTEEEKIKIKEALLKKKKQEKNKKIRETDAPVAAAPVVAAKKTKDDDLQKSFLNFQKIQSDALSKIGGFTFARESENLVVAKKQVEILEKIESNTQGIDEINDVDDGL